MTTKEQGIELIKHFEGCVLSAYQDSVGIWTIGIGSTVYEDGIRVKEGDKISSGKAIALLSHYLRRFENVVNSLLTAKLEQCQFDAVMSFVYNVGTGAFSRSTLLKKINADPDDLTIPKEFSKWCKARGKVIMGLKVRRNAEAVLYITGKLNI